MSVPKMFTARDVLKKRIAEAVVTSSAVMGEAAIIHNTLVTTVDRQCLTNNHIYNFHMA